MMVQLLHGRSADYTTPPGMNRQPQRRQPSLAVTYLARRGGRPRGRPASRRQCLRRPASGSNVRHLPSSSRHCTRQHPRKLPNTPRVLQHCPVFPKKPQEALIHQPMHRTLQASYMYMRSGIIFPSSYDKWLEYAVFAVVQWAGPTNLQDCAVRDEGCGCMWLVCESLKSVGRGIPR